MFWIENLEQIPIKPKLLIPILSDHRKHWTENRISFIYGYCLESNEEFILNLFHNDSKNVQICDLSDFIGNDNYIYQKKYLSDSRYGSVNSKGNFEANLVTYFQTGRKIEVDLPRTVYHYWNKFDEIDNLNDCIPLMKWLEFCRDVKDIFLISYNIDKGISLKEPFLKYDQLLTDLAEIEKNGLFTN